MNCPRCQYTSSQEVTFNLKAQKIRLEAFICKHCDWIWAEDEKQLKAILKFMDWVGKQNDAK